MTERITQQVAIINSLLTCCEKACAMDLQNGMDAVINGKKRIIVVSVIISAILITAVGIVTFTLTERPAMTIAVCMAAGLILLEIFSAISAKHPGQYTGTATAPYYFSVITDTGKAESVIKEGSVVAYRELTLVMKAHSSNGTEMEEYLIPAGRFLFVDFRGTVRAVHLDLADIDVAEEKCDNVKYATKDGRLGVVILPENLRIISGSPVRVYSS